MYHMYIMSWHGFMACIRKQNQQPYEKKKNKHVNKKQKRMTIPEQEKK